MREVTRSRKAVYALIYFVLAVIIIFMPLPSKLTVEMTYGKETGKDISGQLYFDTGNDFNEGETVFGEVDLVTTKLSLVNDKITFDIPENYYSVNRLRIDFSYINEIQVRSINFKNMGVSVLKIVPEDIEQYFIFNCIESVEISGGYMNMISNSGTPSIIATEKFMYLYNNLVNKQEDIRVNLLAILTIGFGCYFAIKQYLIKIKLYINKNEQKIHKILSMCIIAGAFTSLGLVCIMAFGSLDYAHPDEDVTKAAIDYYLGKWLPPNIGDNSMVDTFSAHGFSRLRESTVYYLLAGKVGFLAQYLFSVKHYYRIFNVVLFAIMTGIVIYERKNIPYLFAGIGLSPQILYIFSYATSDAWDYAISFMIVYQLLKKDSYLNKFIESDKLKHNWGKLIFSGFLFANIFMAKKNFYIMLVFAFTILMIRMLKNKNRFRYYMKNYCLIVLICFSFLLIRYGIDVAVYDDDNKNEVVSEMYQKYSAHVVDGNNPNLSGVNLKDKGYSLKFIIVEWEFFDKLFSSTVGEYGWLEYPSGATYITIMTLIYFLILGFMCYYTVKTKNKYTIMQNLLLVLFGFLIIGVVLWNAWTNDFQPQGRYILTIFLMVAFSMNDTLKNKNMQGLLVLGNILSIYSFFIYGITELIINKK